MTFPGGVIMRKQAPVALSVAMLVVTACTTPAATTQPSQQASGTPQATAADTELVILSPDAVDRSLQPAA